MPHDEAYKQAEKKIEEALKSGATELNLSNEYNAPDEKKLTELPESLWKLKQLKSLTIYDTKLTTLPPSLGQLTQLTELHLSDNQLTTLPDSLGQLTQLTSLNLSNNKLTTLPDALGQLTQLTKLDLSNNQLTALPPSLGQLTQLQELDIANNHQLKSLQGIGRLKQLRLLFVHENPQIELSEEIGVLENLRKLAFYKNHMGECPYWLWKLKNLEMLQLGYNDLKIFPNGLLRLNSLQELWLEGNLLEILPDEIGKFSPYLTQVTLSDNNITDLPPSLAQLEHLERLQLYDNPLNPALQSAYKQGLDAVKAYLRSLENAEPLYEAKLVLVGEGNVGKTTLLKALKSNKEQEPRQGEPTTHGVEIDIHGLKLPHPEKDGVEIQLNAWDFGGQDVYRVTHQFFFSRRSLYLLVWEPRRGVQQGQVEDWLNMIRLRVGDDARVIIVSTHCKTGE
ncbi:MAG: leucine-rich repeat domain-containing protein, partial [Chloroflexi bacterium]|nr:leucine-rich repeat domain-containing protein [Chloroflexota bacterium]